MNAHLVSFILDIISWVGIGVFFGLLVYRSQPQRYSNRAVWIPFMSLFSMLTGVIVTCNRALPESGLALDNIAIVFLVTATVSIMGFSRLREKVLQRIEFLKDVFEMNTLMKGGER